MIPSGIVTTLFAGTVGATGSPHQQQKIGVAGVVSFRTRPPHHLQPLGLPGTSAGIATPSSSGSRGRTCILGCTNHQLDGKIYLFRST